MRNKVGEQRLKSALFKNQNHSDLENRRGLRDLVSRSASDGIPGPGAELSLSILISGPRLGLGLQDPATSRYSASRLTRLRAHPLPARFLPLNVGAPGDLSSPDPRAPPFAPLRGPCARLGGLCPASDHRDSGTRFSQAHSASRVWAPVWDWARGRVSSFFSAFQSMPEQARMQQRILRPDHPFSPAPPPPRSSCRPGRLRTPAPGSRATPGRGRKQPALTEPLQAPRRRTLALISPAPAPQPQHKPVPWLRLLHAHSTPTPLLPKPPPRRRVRNSSSQPPGPCSAPWSSAAAAPVSRRPRPPGPRPHQPRPRAGV